jgi:hypothetical protein
MKRAATFLALAALLFLLSSVVLAQIGGGYDLTWNTVDGGGATFSTGGGYSLGGTIGQSDAGALAGGSYSLNGGFWVSAAGGQPSSPAKIYYLPVIFKGY